MSISITKTKMAKKYLALDIDRQVWYWRNANRWSAKIESEMDLTNDTVVKLTKSSLKYVLVFYLYTYGIDVIPTFETK